jgi:hypothetical protein
VPQSLTKLTQLLVFIWFGDIEMWTRRTLFQILILGVTVEALLGNDLNALEGRVGTLENKVAFFDNPILHASFGLFLLFLGWLGAHIFQRLNKLEDKVSIQSVLVGEVRGLRDSFDHFKTEVVGRLAKVETKVASICK